jgi:hypothetical protein
MKAQLEVPSSKDQVKTNDQNVNVVEMKKSVAILNSSDSLFKEIRDKNFNAVNPVLSRTAKELQQANEVLFFNIIKFDLEIKPYK